MIFAAFESTNAEGADTTKLLFLQVESIYKTLKSSNLTLVSKLSIRKINGCIIFINKSNFVQLFEKKIFVV